MKKLALILAVAPLLVSAAPPAPKGANAPKGPGDSEQCEHEQRRMRLARTLGLAEALDLDDAGALRARDTLARFDEKIAPLHQQLQDGARVLMDAAHGDKAAAGKVDATIQSMREVRGKLQALKAEMFEQLTKGLSPEKKARAALFIARFDKRAGPMGPPPAGGPGMQGGRGHGHGMMKHGPKAPGGPGAGPRTEPGKADMGAGPGPGPESGMMMEGPEGERHAMAGAGPMAGPEPEDLED